MSTVNNITYRKQFKSSSLMDLSTMTSDDEQTMFDASRLSIPDSLHENNDNDIVNDLNEQIKTLKLQLMSAHQEIDNLNSENTRLNNELQKSLKCGEAYKKICLTPDRTSYTPRSSKTKSRIPISPKIYSNNTGDGGANSLETGKVNMFNKETQTPTITSDTQVHSLRPSPRDCNPRKNTSDTVTLPKQKNRLCIMSSYCTKGTLPLIEGVFSKQFNYCHFLLPNITIKELFGNIKNKLRDYTLNDYCLIFVGENDLKNRDYIAIVENLKHCLEAVTHTNTVICTATYVKGALIYNYKVELFNNLLCLGLKNNKHVYLFDTNFTLSHEMFSYNTGKLNKHGWRNIYNQIMHNITIDYELYSCPDDSTNDKFDHNSLQTEHNNIRLQQHQETLIISNVQCTGSNIETGRTPITHVSNGILNEDRACNDLFRL